MNKVLVELRIPAVGSHFDIFAPIDVPIKTLNGILADGVAELTNGKYIVSGYEQLCLQEPSGLLNPSYTLQDYGIKAGMTLYLI